jgi:tetratricopeptide (TPR) repeat protein
VIYQKTTKDTVDIKTWMNFVADDSPATKVEMQSGQKINIFPSKVISIPVDKEAVLRNGIVAAEDADKIVDSVYINLKSDIVYKNKLLMLDIIANNNWERPIYFSGGSFEDEAYLHMKDYLQLDGVVYKLVPIKTPLDKRNPFDMGRIDTEKMYDIVMKWDWGNSGSPDIYHDTETRRNGITYRSNLARLAEALLNEGKKEKAENVLDLAMEKMPVKYFEYYSLLEPYVLGFYEVGAPEKAREVYHSVVKIYQEKLQYYSGLKVNRQYPIADEIISTMERYRSLVDIAIVMDEESFAREEAQKFNDYIRLFRHFYNTNEGVDVEQKLQQDDTAEIFQDTLTEEVIEAIEEY